MTQHTTNTPTNSNADEIDRAGFAALANPISNYLTENGIPQPQAGILAAAIVERVAPVIEATTLPKAKVVEAIDSAASFYDYEDGVEVAYNVAEDAKRKLGLESE